MRSEAYNMDCMEAMRAMADKCFDLAAVLLDRNCAVRAPAEKMEGE